MKRKISILLILVCIISCKINLFSQYNNPKPNEQWEQDMVREKKVKACYITNYLVTDTGEILSKNYDSIYYDQAGNLIKEIRGWDASYAFWIFINEYEYNNKNQVICSSSIEVADGKLLDQTNERFFYGSGGKLIRAYYKNEEDGLVGASFRYKKGKLISTNYYGIYYTFKYRGDSCFVYYNGKELSYCYLNNKKIREFSSGTSYEYDWNDSDWILSRRHFVKNKLFSAVFYEYKNGLLEKSFVIDEYGRMTLVDRYTYDYFP